MTFEESFLQYLDDQEVGTKGTDMFVGELPKDVNNGVMIVAGASVNQNGYFDIRESNLEIWAINKSSNEAFAKLFEIQQAIHGNGNYAISGYWVYFSGTSSIEDLDRDLMGRKLVKLNARIIYRDLQNIIS